MKRSLFGPLVAIVAIVAFALLLPAAAGAAEIQRKVWPTPTESQLDTDAAELPYQRVMDYFAAVGVRVKAQSTEEFAALRFVGLGACTRASGPLQLRLVTSHPETELEVRERRLRLVAEALDRARTRGTGLTLDEIDALTRQLSLP